MKYGVCIGDDVKNIPSFKEMGFDYIEGKFYKIVEDDEYFSTLKTLCEKHGIPCEAMNNFLPSTLPVVGEVDYKKIKQFVKKGISRAKELGVKTVVFGSGGARKYFGKTTCSTAIKQIVKFLKMVVPMFSRANITLVIEPLSEGHDPIQTVRDGGIIASIVNKKGLKLLGDLRHISALSEPCENITDFADIFYHAHVAEPKTGNASLTENEWYLPFFSSVLKTKAERCSFEGNRESLLEGNNGKTCLALYKSYEEKIKNDTPSS